MLTFSMLSNMVKLIPEGGGALPGKQCTDA